MNPQPDDDVWRALAHPTRRRILDALVADAKSTGALVAEVGLERHAVMAHLDILRAAGLVTSEKRGRVRMNFLNAVPIQNITQRWLTPLSGPWVSALIAVRDEAERSVEADKTDHPLDDWKISG